MVLTLGESKRILGKTVTAINLGIEICPEMHALIKMEKTQFDKNP